MEEGTTDLSKLKIYVAQPQRIRFKCTTCEAPLHSGWYVIGVHHENGTFLMLAGFPEGGTSCTKCHKEIGTAPWFSDSIEETRGVLKELQDLEPDTTVQPLFFELSGIPGGLVEYEVPQGILVQ